mmetsp:Transcript_36543/g.41095  ORF Transcript_36543/g.41095 Transcript_36543/m.41095 type:complete len:134 (+) Transcript_36543:90-491(+)
MMIHSILTNFSSSISQLSFFSVFLIVAVVTMNNSIVPTQGLADVRSGTMFHQRNSLVSVTRRMMMMDENIITITKSKNTDTENVAIVPQLTKTMAEYRQEMIELEYEIFYLEEDLMNIVHEKKELLMMRQQCL